VCVCVCVCVAVYTVSSTRRGRGLEAAAVNEFIMIPPQQYSIYSRFLSVCCAFLKLKLKNNFI